MDPNVNDLANDAVLDVLARGALELERTLGTDADGGAERAEAILANRVVIIVDADGAYTVPASAVRATSPLDDPAARPSLG